MQEQLGWSDPLPRVRQPKPKIRSIKIESEFLLDHLAQGGRFLTNCGKIFDRDYEVTFCGPCFKEFSIFGLEKLIVRTTSVVPRDGTFICLRACVRFENFIAHIKRNSVFCMFWRFDEKSNFR